MAFTHVLADFDPNVFGAFEVAQKRLAKMAGTGADIEDSTDRCAEQCGIGREESGADCVIFEGGHASGAGAVKATIKRGVKALATRGFLRVL